MSQVLTCPSGFPQDPCLLVRNGTRTRQPKELGGGQVSAVRVQRYFCRTHHQSLSFIPSSLLPRLHYLAQVVNRCVDRRVSSSKRPAPEAPLPHRKTVKRWLKRLGDSQEAILKTVRRVGGEGWETVCRVVGGATRQRLLRIWLLLEALATGNKENRVPYHYVLIRSP